MFSLFSTSHYKSSKAQSQGGFGMVEMLVSISIIVIVSSVILVRQSSFNSAILLRSQAYEIALQIRNVQFSAVSVSSDGGGYLSVVGVHFDEDEDSNSTYRIFSDQNSNGYYDTNNDVEFGTQGILDPRFEIREMRSVGATLSSTGGLSVVFIRPNFDAQFYDSSGPVDASSVQIDVARSDGSAGASDVRTIEITSTGQISVQ